MKKKIGLKGFSALGAFPTIVNTITEYSASGEKINFVGSSKCNVSDNSEDYSIPGDDDVYDSGAEWEDTTLEIVIQEIDLPSLAAMAGCSINEAKSAIEEGVYDIPEEMALVYRALRRDGGYRCYRYYRCKLISYKVDHSTRGSSSDGQPYTLTFRCMPRAIDGKIRGTEDVADMAASVTWLASIPTVTLAA